MKTVLLKALYRPVQSLSKSWFLFFSRNCQAHTKFHKGSQGILSSQHNPEKGIKLDDSFSSLKTYCKNNNSQNCAIGFKTDI